MGKVPQLKCEKCFDKNDYLNKYLKDSGYSRVDFNKCDAEPYVSQDSPDTPAWTIEEILAIKSPKKGNWEKAQSRLQKLGMISWNRPGCSGCKMPLKTGTVVYHNFYSRKNDGFGKYKIVKRGTKVDKRHDAKKRVYVVSTGKDNAAGPIFGVVASGHAIRSFHQVDLDCESCHAKKVLRYKEDRKKRRKLMSRLVRLEQAMF